VTTEKWQFRRTHSESARNGTNLGSLVVPKNDSAFGKKTFGFMSICKRLDLLNHRAHGAPCAVTVDQFLTEGIGSALTGVGAG